MGIRNEAASVATAWIASLAAAATPVVVQAASHVTTLADFGMACVGGLIGGWLLTRFLQAEKRADNIQAVILSGLLGLVLGPLIAHWLVSLPFIPSGDFLAAYLAGGALVGALGPPLFGLIYAIALTFREDPTSIADWFGKFKNSFPKINVSIGGSEKRGRR